MRPFDPVRERFVRFAQDNQEILDRLHDGEPSPEDLRRLIEKIDAVPPSVARIGLIQKLKDTFFGVPFVQSAMVDLLAREAEGWGDARLDLDRTLQAIERPVDEERCAFWIERVWDKIDRVQDIAVHARAYALLVRTTPPGSKAHQRALSGVDLCLGACTEDEYGEVRQKIYGVWDTRWALPHVKGYLFDITMQDYQQQKKPSRKMWRLRGAAGYAQTLAHEDVLCQSWDALRPMLEPETPHQRCGAALEMLRVADHLPRFKMMLWGDFTESFAQISQAGDRMEWLRDLLRQGVARHDYLSPEVMLVLASAFYNEAKGADRSVEQRFDDLREVRRVCLSQIEAGERKKDDRGGALPAYLALKEDVQNAILDLADGLSKSSEERRHMLTEVLYKAGEEEPSQARALTMMSRDIDALESDEARYNELYKIMGCTSYTPTAQRAVAGKMIEMLDRTDEPMRRADWALSITSERETRCPLTVELLTDYAVRHIDRIEDYFDRASFLSIALLNYPEGSPKAQAVTKQLDVLKALEGPNGDRARKALQPIPTLEEQLARLG